MLQMSKILHDTDTDDSDAKATAIPQVFSKNSHAKNPVTVISNNMYILYMFYVIFHNYLYTSHNLNSLLLFITTQ